MTKIPATVWSEVAISFPHDCVEDGEQICDHSQPVSFSKQL